ncbi:MAG TPA: AsmA-like C-terminal region-containing protein, partial [Gammaproteobacteria bacterium]|nr:AsmA-like C-terminal region-containing protein [Gammaproteobacteria bacterium]
MLRKNDTLKASGQWYFAPSGERTRLAGSLASSAIDKTLLLADIKSTILNSKAATDFILSWTGSPFDFALAHLSGEMKVDLKSGVLVDVNPGFGRVLSLLSVQSLQRRLRLDFSDVFKKGFSFDEITALITIDNGLAHVNNLVMKAPAAEMKMQGDVNLASKQLDLSANVVAHISSSLPLAATIASGGNPIVGAVGVGVWAVDKIVKSTAGDKLGSNYRITGTWEKPIVKGK